MRIRPCHLMLMAVLSGGWSACTGHSRLQTPLVPTPNAPWRSTTPTRASSKPSSIPATTRRSLANGFTVLSATVPDAPRAHMVLVLTHASDPALVAMVSRAWVESLFHTHPEAIPNALSVDHEAVRISWAATPAELPAMANVACSLFHAPPDDDLLRQQRSLASMIPESPREAYAGLGHTAILAQRLGRKLPSEAVRDRALTLGPNREVAPKLRSVYAESFLPKRSALIVAGPPEAIQQLESTDACTEGREGSPEGAALDKPMTSAFERTPILLLPRAKGGTTIEFALVVPSEGVPTYEHELLARIAANALWWQLDAALERQEENTASFSLHSYVQPWGVAVLGSISTDEGRVVEVLHLVADEVQALRSVPRPRAFEWARTMLAQTSPLTSLNTARIAADLAQRFGDHLTIPQPEDTAEIERVTQLSPSELQQKVRALLVEPAFAIAGHVSDLGALLQWQHFDYRAVP